jgi:hypothetical protein
MNGQRVNWRGAARMAAIAGACAVAVAVLPGLLKAPAPPKPAPDVGLPKVITQAEAPANHEKPSPKRHEPKRKPLEIPRTARISSKHGVVGRHKNHRKRHRQPKPAPVPASPPPAPAPVPVSTPTYYAPPAPAPPPHPEFGL